MWARPPVEEVSFAAGIRMGGVLCRGGGSQGAKLNRLRRRTIEKRDESGLGGARRPCRHRGDSRGNNLPQAPMLEEVGDTRPSGWRRGTLGSDGGNQ